MAASCLVALGGPSHEEAYGMLAAMAEGATRQPQRRPVAFVSDPASRGSARPDRREFDPRAARLLGSARVAR
jgi:hypothetical protein